jgi:hypothetical protein
MNQVKTYMNNMKINHLNTIKEYLLLGTKEKLLQNVKQIDGILKTHHQKTLQTYSNLSKKQMMNYIKNTITYYSEINDNQEINRHIHNDIIYQNKNILNTKIFNMNLDMENDTQNINNHLNEINDYIANIKETLDKAVYGQNKAKKQIERIIGQWINGEQN